MSSPELREGPLKSFLTLSAGHWSRKALFVRGNTALMANATTDPNIIKPYLSYLFQALILMMLHKNITAVKATSMRLLMRTPK